MQDQDPVPNPFPNPDESIVTEGAIEDDGLKEIPDFEVISVEGCLSSSNVLGF